MFIFEKMWIREAECSKIIEQNSHQGSGWETMQDVMAIIAKCNDNLSRWNKQTFGNVCKNLAEAKQ